MGGGPPPRQDDAHVNAAVERSPIGTPQATTAGSILAGCRERSTRPLAALKVPRARHTASISFPRVKRQQSTLVGVAFHFHIHAIARFPIMSGASLNAAVSDLGSCNPTCRLTSLSDVGD